MMRRAAARTTRRIATQRRSEVGVDHDEEDGHVVAVMTTPNSQPSCPLDSHDGAQGSAGAITGNVNLASSPTQATTVRASQAHGSDGSVRVGNKRKLTSIVWERNFEKQIVNGESQAECMYCHKKIIAKGTTLQQSGSLCECCAISCDFQGIMYTCFDRTQWVSIGYGYPLGLDMDILFCPCVFSWMGNE
ncbi:hypothetical protein VPH35_110631 [Triticum aestivum]